MMTATPDKIMKLFASFQPNRTTELNNTCEEPDDVAERETPPIEGSTKTSSLDLRSPEAYFTRIETYTPMKWFAKPLALSPMICAQYGWLNTERDLLECISCKNCLCADLPPCYDSSYKERCALLIKKLVSEHVKSCSWTSNHSSDAYKMVPHYSNEEVRRTFKKRCQQLKRMSDSLPHISYESLQKRSCDAHLAGRLAYMFDKMETNTSKAATIMALTGWTRSEKKDVVICTHCRRQIGLWNYKSISPVQPTDFCGQAGDNANEEPDFKKRKLDISTTESKAFDPVFEHRYWCPWTQLNLTKKDQSESVNPDQSDDSQKPKDLADKPGWHLVLKVLAPNLLNTNTSSFSKALKEREMHDGLKSIRHLFSSWTSPVEDV